MKYLVGADNNTWRLPDAIGAAADGDTIEFQAGYSPVVDGITINKSLPDMQYRQPTADC